MDLDNIDVFTLLKKFIENKASDDRKEELRALRALREKLPELEADYIKQQESISELLQRDACNGPQFCGHVKAEEMHAAATKYSWRQAKKETEKFQMLLLCSEAEVKRLKNCLEVENSESFRKQIVDLQWHCMEKDKVINQQILKMKEMQGTIGNLSQIVVDVSELIQRGCKI